MSDEKYELIEDPRGITRRDFLTMGGLLAAFAAVPSVFLRHMAVKRNDYIRARAAGLYKDDSISQVRVSHANEGVSMLYKDFLGSPLSELSEELLHTAYVNRTKLAV